MISLFLPRTQSSGETSRHKPRAKRDTFSLLQGNNGARLSLRGESSDPGTSRHPGQLSSKELCLFPNAGLGFFFLDVVQFRTKDNGMCEWPGTKGGWEMAFPLTVGLPTWRVL